MVTDGRYASQRIAELDQVIAARWPPEVFCRFQCVWLSLVLSLPARVIADALGLNVSTVRRIQTEFAREGAKAIEGKGNRGGRRNQYLSLEEESAFLRDHVHLFGKSGAADVKALKEAFEVRTGKDVHRTTIYRLLERHGRKAAPGGRRPGGEAGDISSRKKGAGAPAIQARRRKLRKAR